MSPMPEHLRRLFDPNDTFVREIYDMTHPRPFYALESLPELIGDRQFKMLCDALGISDAMADAKAGRADKFDAGAFFAKAVQQRVIHQRVEASRQARRLEPASPSGDL